MESSPVVVESWGDYIRKGHKENAMIIMGIAIVLGLIGIFSLSFGFFAFGVIFYVLGYLYFNRAKKIRKNI